MILHSRGEAERRPKGPSMGISGGGRVVVDVVEAPWSGTRLCNGIYVRVLEGACADASLCQWLLR